MQFLATDSSETTPLLNGNNITYVNDIDIKIVENGDIVGFIITSNTPIRFVGILDFGCHSLAFDEYRLHILADSLQYVYDDVTTTIPSETPQVDDVSTQPFIETMENIIITPDSTIDIEFNGGIFDPSISIDFGDSAIVNGYTSIIPTKIIANITSVSEEKPPVDIKMRRGSLIHYGYTPSIEVSNTIVGGGPAGVFTTDFLAGGGGDTAWGSDWDLLIEGTIDSLTGFFKTSTSTTPSSNTGPNAAHDGYYMFTERSGNNSGSGQRATASTNNFHELTEIKFHYHMCGSGFGNFSLESKDVGNTWVSRWSRSGAQHTQSDSFEEIILSTSGWEAKAIRFVFDNTSNYASDLALDNIIITSL